MTLRLVIRTRLPPRTLTSPNRDSIFQGLQPSVGLSTYFAQPAVAIVMLSPLRDLHYLTSLGLAVCRTVTDSTPVLLPPLLSKPPSPSLRQRPSSEATPAFPYPFPSHEILRPQTPFRRPTRKEPHENYEIARGRSALHGRTPVTG
jgi:hypothetical protein